MAVVPYQPTYSIQPKFGYRYSSQPVAPNIATSRDQQMAMTPQTLDGQAAVPAPQQPTYLQDPFGGRFGVQGQYTPQPATGFRTQSFDPSYTIPTVDQTIADMPVYRSFDTEDKQTIAKIPTVEQPVPQQDDSSCFPAYTLITMANGTTKPIAEIEAGDVVISFDKEENKVEDEVTVVHTHEVGSGRDTDTMVKIVLQNGKELITTSNHPIYSPEHRAFKWAKHFEHGELVKHENGMMYAVDVVEDLGAINEVVYNLEIKNNHTYIAEGIFVHNGSGGSDSDGPGSESSVVGGSSNTASANVGSSNSASSSFGGTGVGRQDYQGAPISNVTGNVPGSSSPSTGYTMPASIAPSVTSSANDDNNMSGYTVAPAGYMGYGQTATAPDLGGTGIGRQDYQGAPIAGVTGSVPGSTTDDNSLGYVAPAAPSVSSNDSLGFGPSK